MATQTRAGPIGFSEFLEIVPEDQKADLLDGVILMASPENLEHNDLIGWLVEIVGVYVRQRRLGRLTVNRVAYRLAPRSAPEPDVAFVRAAREADVKSGYVAGPPDLAVEIVSPDSAERDYESKRRAYETAGVAEYWIIDPDERRVTFLCLECGRFVESQPVEHVFESRVLPGLRLDVRWLWERPLPPTWPILQALLQP